MHSIKIFTGFLLLMSLNCAEATDYFFEKDKALKKGFGLTIIAYDPRLGGVFEVQTSEDQRQRNHYTRLGDLSVSLSGVDRNKHKRRPKKLVGKTFKIDQKPLTTYKAPRHIK